MPTTSPPTAAPSTSSPASTTPADPVAACVASWPLRDRIACVEEVALRMGFIDADACFQLGARQGKSGYGAYVMAVAKAFDAQR